MTPRIPENCSTLLDWIGVAIMNDAPPRNPNDDEDDDEDKDADDEPDDEPAVVREPDE
jgi:hypothetical protein